MTRTRRTAPTSSRTGRPWRRRRILAPVTKRGRRSPWRQIWTGSPKTRRSFVNQFGTAQIRNRFCASESYRFFTSISRNRVNQILVNSELCIESARVKSNKTPVILLVQVLSIDPYFISKVYVCQIIQVSAISLRCCHRSLTLVSNLDNSGHYIQR